MGLDQLYCIILIKLIKVFVKSSIHCHTLISYRHLTMQAYEYSFQELQPSPSSPIVMHMAKIKHDEQHLAISFSRANKKSNYPLNEDPMKHSTITLYHAKGLDMDEAKFTVYLGQHPMLSLYLRSMCFKWPYSNDDHCLQHKHNHALVLAPWSSNPLSKLASPMHQLGLMMP